MTVLDAAFAGLDPEEVDDPKLMQLWIARLGTPLPTAWDDHLDPAFQFAGMVWRDLKPRHIEPEAFTPYGGPRPFETVGVPQLTLTWPRLLEQHARALPINVYCSMVSALPADRSIAVMPRVRFGRLDLGLPLRHRPGLPASCVIEPEEPVEPFGAAMTWYSAALLPVEGAR